jgi:transcription initiation factor TFIIIB Brf1 subunit/transcription initiation factor TFIIB
MHQFYVLHPFTIFHHGEMAAACLLLACKVENIPRPMEEVIKMQRRCQNQPSLDTKSEVSEFHTM